MNNLSDIMQARLDAWRKNPLPVPSAEKVRGATVRRAGKGDHGDATTLEEWEEECKRSQKRK